MARPAGKESIEVRDGVYIKMRDNGIWQVHFKLDGAEKAVRRSLKTKDLNEAKTLALDAFDEARLRRLSGKPETAVSFEKLYEEYLANLPESTSKSYHQNTIKRHLSPYFKSHVPDFSEIRNADVLDYVEWRRTKSPKEPKPITLNRENVVLRGLIDFAVAKGYLTKNDAPTVRALKEIKDRRPHFTRDQLKTLIETAEARIDETKNPTTREQRQLLHDWIIVLVNTGLRTGEATSLQWSDVFLDVDEPYLHAKRGKTKPRDVVPLDPAVDCLKAIRSRQSSYMISHGKQLTKKHFVFSLPNSKSADLVPVKSFRTGFNNLLKACELYDSDRKLQLSPYSLRHSYATIRIEEGTGTFLLTGQMGTGVSMIEKHYGHIKTREQRAELTKTREKTQSKSSDDKANLEKIDVPDNSLNNEKAEIELIKRQVLEELKADESGMTPEPGSQLYKVLFNGLVQEKLDERRFLDEHKVSPNPDLPDSSPD